MERTAFNGDREPQRATACKGAEASREAAEGVGRDARVVGLDALINEDAEFMFKGDTREKMRVEKGNLAREVAAETPAEQSSKSVAAGAVEEVGVSRLTEEAGERARAAEAVDGKEARAEGSKAENVRDVAGVARG